MKAAVRSKYGLPGVISIQEIEIPTPKDNEVLIRVYATAVSRTDCHLVAGTPFIMRLFTGLFKPRIAITGTDFAGQIEATGKNVTLFKAGDRVMGFCFLGAGSHAEYLVTPETESLIIMPDSLSYNQAAACIEGAFYALNGIHSVNIVAGQKALVIGATGAIGSSFVQLFKYYGVIVTAVCDSKHQELVKSLGAVKVIDYKTEDFTSDIGRFDFIFDAVSKSTFAKCRHLLTKHGIYSSSEGFLNVFLALITPLFGGKKVVFRPPKDLKGSLLFIRELIEKEMFMPVIDSTYPIDRIVEAFTYVATGQKIGNVIITMEASGSAAESVPF